MLVEFKNWLEGKMLQELEDLGYKLEFTQLSDEDSDSFLRIDFDSNKYLGRVTLWNSGMCHREIMEFESERIVLDDFVHIHADSNFCEYFDHFFSMMAEDIEPKSQLS
jgi:hypothetical protein